MKKVDFKNLSWPRGLNLNLLSHFLSEAELINLIIQNSMKDRKARRIVLPSKKTIVKVFCYFYGQLAEEGELGWDEVMAHVKGKFKTLKETGIDRKRIKQLYHQRRKEILNGR